jgi:hypothetical protein
MKTQRLHLLRFAVLLGGLGLASGCIKINTTLYISPDGSGSWQAQYSMPGHMIRQTQMVRQLAEDLQKAGGTATATVAKADLPLVFDEAAIRERFKPLEREGIRLSKVQTRSRGGWQTVELVVKFERLEALLRQSFLDNCGFSLKRTGDVAKLVVTLPRGEGSGEPPNMADPAVSRSLTPFLGGLAVTARIEVPGEIRNSNSASSDQRMATWEWDFDKDAKALERLAQDKMIVVFDASTLRVPDFEKQAKP